MLLSCSQLKLYTQYEKHHIQSHVMSHILYHWLAVHLIFPASSCWAPQTWWGLRFPLYFSKMTHLCNSEQNNFLCFSSSPVFLEQQGLGLHEHAKHRFPTPQNSCQWDLGNTLCSEKLDQTYCTISFHPAPSSLTNTCCCLASHALIQIHTQWWMLIPPRDDKQVRLRHTRVHFKQAVISISTSFHRNRLCLFFTNEDKSSW